MLKFTNKAILFLYYLLFFIAPIVMAPFTSELFEFNKLIFIYFISVGVLFFWTLKMILSRKIIIKKTPFNIPIMVFIASQIFSTLFSIDRHTSLYGYYGRFNGGLISILAFVVLYYGFVSNFSILVETTRRVVSTILKISLISSTIVIIWGIPGKFGYDLSCLLFLGQFNNNCWTDQFRPAERMFSTLGQPNWLGAYLAINFFIGLYFYFKKILNQSLDSARDKVQDDKKTVLFILYLFVNFSGILFTRSRSALLSLAVGLAAFFLLVTIKHKEYLVAQYKKIIVLCLGLILSTLIFKTGIAQIDKFLSISSFYKASNSTASVESGLVQQSGVTTSSDIRKIVWRGAVDLGLKYPLFGTGVETFAYSYYFVRPIEHNLTSEWDYLYNKAHNEFLNYFATTGFIGLGSYLFFVGSVLYISFKKISNFQFPISKQDSIANYQLLISCLLISYLTILITNFFGFSTTTINLFFYLIPAFLVIISNPSTSLRTSQQLSISRLSWLQKSMILILLSSTFYLLSSLSKYYLADIKYSRGDNLAKSSEYQQSARILNEAYNLKYEHLYEDKLSHVLANMAFIYSYESVKGLSKKSRQTSDELNLKSLKASPKNVLYWKTRAKNHYLFYQIDLDRKDLETAIQALKEAEKLSPTDPKIPYSLAIFHSLLEEEIKEPAQKTKLQGLAFRYIDASIQLKPDYRDGYFLKGQLLKKAGRNNEARKSFELILKQLNPNDSEAKKELESF